MAPIPRVLRLHEDTHARCETDNEYVKLYKKDLFHEISPPEDGQVVIRLLDTTDYDADDTPKLVPQQLVYEATPGLYRAKRRTEGKYHFPIPRGAVVKVVKIGCKGYGSMIGRGWWGVKLLDGSKQLTFCDPATLEPVEDPDEQTLAADAATSAGVWSALKRGFSREAWRDHKARIRGTDRDGHAVGESSAAFVERES